jgi:type IV secretion system protein VirB5
MPALHKSNPYKPLSIPNPFREGQDKAYADILQDKMNEMRWWRRVIGSGFLFLFAVSIGLFAWALSRQATVPVLINVMPSGEAQYLGEVRQTSAPAVPEAAIQFHLRKFITNLRSVSTDPQVLYNNIDECYSMITANYEPLMTRALRASSPFELVGKIRRTVEIQSILKITGSSYQADWSESAETSSGRRSVRMRALLTVKILPATAESIKKNPLGIYIENCEMTEL